MELICQELGIPKKQIKETRNPDRFIVLTKKSWLKSIAQNGKVHDFPVHGNLEEWPVYGNETGFMWCKAYFQVYKKLNHKVIPLPRIRLDHQTENEQPLSFSQLLHYVSQSNHKNLWKSSFKQYSTSRAENNGPHLNDINSKKVSESTIILLPYDNVLKEVITRIYGIQIIDINIVERCFDSNTASLNENDSNISITQKHFSSLSSECHVNLYPIVGAIETNSQIILIFDSFIEHSLYDCITYSPAILDKANNKQLFIIYQLLNLMKSLHDKGLLLGEINLNDIYITENLWLQIIPRLDCNTIKLNEINNYVVSPSSNNQHSKQSPSSSSQLNATNPLEFYSSKFTSKISNDLNLRYNLKDYCEAWYHGQISNFDYLTILNNLSGRRIGCPGYHHIMPWVTDFTKRSGLNWRDLTKSKYRLNKGDPQLDLMFSNSTTSNFMTDSVRNDAPHHVSDVLSEITYYVYMARRTTKSVLCRHVRPIWVPAEYPASIQRLQEWTPDECIPEFYNDPLVFKSIHEDLPNLELPTWSSCPENFIAKHREALESQYVSERLHHWIDLTFGYKLTGSAAIKAKNVCLSIVDDHKNLSKHGVVQLFQYPHPPKQSQSIWTAKFPPRIYPQSEIKRRLTRSSEDLTSSSQSPIINAEAHTNKIISHSIEENNTSIINNNIERSTSYHTNVVQKINNNIIVLPKDYNPICQLQSVENMDIFVKKTFYNFDSTFNSNTDKFTHNNTISDANALKLSFNYDDECDNAFTNKIFNENFSDQLLLKNTKSHTKNFKQVVAERRFRELQILGCIIVELFLCNKLRPLCGGSITIQSYKDRLESCLTLLKHDFELLPKFIQYPIKLLLNCNGINSNSVITEKGLPNPSAHQFLQPLLSNSLFPFPNNYIQIYNLIKSIHQFDLTDKLLNLLTFFECDGKNCSKYENIDKTRILIQRKIAECKVKSCVTQIEGLLEPVGYEQFNSIELLLPHIVDLIKNDDTSIMAAWYLFDPIATALGPLKSVKLLLESVLQLYDVENDDKIKFLNSNFDSSMKFNNTINYIEFKNKKSYKLYHHSFLLKLIIRFGLRCFLNNFISPLIEGVGGYKDPEKNNYLYHSHNNVLKRSKSNIKSIDLDIDPTTGPLMSSPLSDNENNLTQNESDENKTLSPASDNDVNKLPDELFEIENEQEINSGGGLLKSSSSNSILKLIDQFDLIKSDGSTLDLRLNHTQAEEVTEDTPINDTDNFQINDFKFYSELRQLNSSFDDDGLSYQSVDSPQKSPGTIISDFAGPKSPTIPIPSNAFHHGKQLSSIGCEIGSRKSTDSNDFFGSSVTSKTNETVTNLPLNQSTDCNPNNKLNQKSSRPSRISEMSAESLIWLSHRLGPVLTARYLSRNLLKMLTLCYVGQENLFPDEQHEVNPTNRINDVQLFSIADGRCVGDQNSIKVLECLTGISTLFGDQFILLQYFPHVSELIALCKKRITPSLEGGLISSLQLVKYLVPYLSDSTLMDQIHDIILRSIIHPIIRLLGSSRCIMPNGFLARSVLARKLLDTIYVLAIRIGPEMSREHLCVPALQRFFCIFNKAYGITDKLKYVDTKNPESSPTNSDDCNFVEIRRDGGTREWCIRGSPIQISHVREDSFDSITPPIPSSSPLTSNKANMTVKEKAMEEIQDVFTSSLAHIAYTTFLKYLGETIMTHTVKNLSLIVNLCYEHEQHDGDSAINKNMFESTNSGEFEDETSVCLNSFGTNAAVVGNRIEVQPDVKNKKSDKLTDSEILGFVTYKLDQVNSSRHVRGNWLAYWEHEIGRSDKDNHFNLKQIKLQSFHGHTNTVRAILPLDNENSFMSASKDKTIKLWSLRSEGDGSKISSCQYTYTNHKKSVHSLTFLESHRFAISCDSGVHLWDPFVGAQIAQLDSSRYSPVSVVKTFPAPSSLVICGTADSLIKTIDTRCFNYVNEWKISSAPFGSVRCVAVSPSGAWIGVGLSSGQLILLDGKTGILIASWKANEGELLQLAAPNESHLISSSLDHSISVWSTLDGSLLFHLKSPPEPAHCLICNGSEIITGTPANRIGVHSSLSRDSIYTITKLRSENFRGVLTSLAVLPLNRMLLVGGDSGNISLLC